MKQITYDRIETLPHMPVKKQCKLIKVFPEYLNSKRKMMTGKYGKVKTDRIFEKALNEYPDIVKKIPVFQTSMYDTLMTMAAKMAAVKKGMRAAGIGTEEFVKFYMEDTRSTARKIPAFLRKILGKIYLSELVRNYLKKVAKTLSANQWPTRIIDGTPIDDFIMSIETRNCRMVGFWESIGEGDIKPYCTFFDFTSAELLGLGLRQVSTIDSGVCKYCFYRNGKVCWPEAVQQIL